MSLLNLFVTVFINGTNLNITKKGEIHGRGSFEEESIALFYWDGPPKPETVE